MLYFRTNKLRIKCRLRRIFGGYLQAEDPNGTRWEKFDLNIILVTLLNKHKLLVTSPLNFPIVQRCFYNRFIQSSYWCIIKPLYIFIII